MHAQSYSPVRLVFLDVNSDTVDLVGEIGKVIPANHGLGIAT